MGDLVNLRLVKKRRARAADAAEAEAQRLRHGRTKTQKRSDRLDEQRIKQAVDQAKLDPEPI